MPASRIPLRKKPVKIPFSFSHSVPHSAFLDYAQIVLYADPEH